MHWTLKGRKVYDVEMDTLAGQRPPAFLAGNHIQGDSGCFSVVNCFHKALNCMHGGHGGYAGDPVCICRTGL